MTLRLELIPSYIEAKRRKVKAQEALNHAREIADCLREELTKATKAEAADQIGLILVWPSGRRAQIVGIGAHYSNAALAYPIVVDELSKRDTWGKRTSHLYTHIFNFELRTWEFGTVSAEGEFKLATTLRGGNVITEETA